ncbi:hypothetical protein KAR91_79085, partial [Candidatus Pacearchaeota archaeon]|nr:hypothetical protein [Candidatus Pacearchaeota archaeon]
MADLGFFSPTKIVKKKKVNERKIVACESCGAYKNCSSPKLGLSGNGDKGILIIGNPVTRREDITGKVFSDMSSAYLREELSNIGVSLERDCWSMNSVQCMADKTTPAMLEGCRRRLDKTIRELKPKKILLLGETATDMFLHNRIQKSRVGSGNMERWLHDELIPDQEYGCFVSVCYHPSFVVSALTERKKLMKKWGSYREKEGQQLWHNKKLLDDDNFRIRSLYFKKHLKVILQNKQFFKEDYEKYCSFIPTVEEAISLMRAMKKSKYLGWDLETTSLQPYGDDSEILCVSMSDGTTSYSFPFFVDDKRFMRVFKNVLTNSEAKTIIANAQFEENYTRAKTGISTIEHCCHDTVLAAHIISPTISGNTGLKVNAYKVCGVIGFDAEVEPFIKGRVEKDPYSLNRLKELPIKTVGIYNAMDSLLTAKVAFYQMNIINNNPKLNSVFDLYMRGQVAFADMSFQGFVVDETQLIKNEMELEQKLTVIEYDLKNTNEVGRWYKEHPNTEFNFKSNKHLSELFFDLLDYSTGKVTASGG